MPDGKTMLLVTTGKKSQAEKFVALGSNFRNGLSFLASNEFHT